MIGFENPYKFGAAISAFAMLGDPYLWGKADCSQKIVEWSQCNRMNPWGWDRNAQGMYDDAREAGRPNGAGEFGALNVYGSSASNITHVTLNLDTNAILGANGGYKSTDTVAEARALGAQWRMDDPGYRSDLIDTIMPAWAYPWIRYATAELNVREAPSLEADIAEVIPANTVINLLDPPRESTLKVADGYSWARIRALGLEGWAAYRFMRA